MLQDHRPGEQSPQRRNRKFPPSLELPGWATSQELFCRQQQRPRFATIAEETSDTQVIADEYTKSLTIAIYRTPRWRTTPWAGSSAAGLPAPSSLSISPKHAAGQQEVRTAFPVTLWRESMLI